jgi:hypothetical protein
LINGENPAGIEGVLVSYIGVAVKQPLSEENNTSWPLIIPSP